MLFFDEAAAELAEALGSDPAWVTTQADDVAACYRNTAYNTRLSAAATGTVGISSDLLVQSLHFSDGLRGADSMELYIEIAQALVSRNKQKMLQHLAPGNIRLS